MVMVISVKVYYHRFQGHRATDNAVRSVVEGNDHSVADAVVRSVFYA